MKRVLVTGPNGFVGSHLVPFLGRSGYEIVEASRTAVGEISAVTDWSRALAGVDCVVHLAARVHVMHDPSSDPLTAYRTVNVDGTAQLARQAAEAGVRRFVYLSSIKAIGEDSTETLLTEETSLKSSDPYGISKREAEEALSRISRETGLEVSIIRPPLVYGAGVKANFLALLRAVDRGMPLPFAMIRNRRSLVYVGNLCSAILASAERPEAAGKTFLISDGPGVSTPDLVRGIARALGKRPRLVPIPVSMLKAAGALTGRSPAVGRLIGSLEVDDSRIRRELGWIPPKTLDSGLEETVKWYRA